MYVAYELYGLAMASMTLSLALFFIGMNMFNKWINHLSDYVLVVSFFLFGLSYAQMRRHSDVLTDYGDRVHMEGYVYDVYREADDQVRLIVVADTLTTEHHRYYNARGFASFEADTMHIVPGERIEVSGYLKSPKSYVFSDFDNASFMYDRNLQFDMSVLSCIRTGGCERSYSSFMGRARECVYDRLVMSGVDADNVRFLMALIIGDRSRLPQSSKTEFSNSGLIHIIAVSGLHVCIIYSILVALFSVFGTKRKWYVSVFIIVVLCLYSAVCGLSPSSMRAVVMMSVIELSAMVKRKNEPLSTLCVAAFVILVIDPYSIRSVGFWLSFSAVWGIMSFYPFVYGLNPFKNKYVSRYFYSAMCVATVAQVTTMPFSMIVFHKFPSYFLINNLIVINFVYPIIGISLLAILLAHFMGIGVVLNYIVNALRYYMSFASSIPGSTIENIPFSMCDLVLCVLFLYSLSWLCRKDLVGVNWKNMSMLCALIGSLFFASCTYTTVISLKKRAIVVYETYNNVGISHVTDRKAEHFLTDTIRTSARNAASRFDKKVFAKTSHLNLLHEGVKICFPDKVICVPTVDDDIDSMECSVIIVIGDALPNATKYEHVVLTSRTTSREVWQEYCDVNGIQYDDTSNGPVWIPLQ